MKKQLILVLALLVGGCVAAPAPAAAPTVDPFVAVAQAERTAEAAQEQADFYSLQLTATAQAPIIAMTATAGAWQMELAYASATSQSIAATETAVMTQTAMAWTPTPNATSTVVAAQAQAAATQIANETRLSDLEVERARTTNLIRAISLYVVGFVLLVVALVWGIGLARKYSVYAIPTNEHGDKSAILIDGIVMDVDRLPNGMGQMTKSYVAQLPAVTADRQDAVTMRDQMIDLRGRSKAMQKLIASQGKALPEPTETPVLTESVDVPLPAWDLINQWDGTAKPLGVGTNGLITSKSASPHILISGMTGSGKTRFMLRTVTAASLARGGMVINIGYSNAGYGVFQAHANFHSVQLTNPVDVIDCLAQVYGELKSRKELLGGETLEWEYWPGGQPPRPFVDVVIDELGNMAEDITTENGPAANKALWSFISRIANEGRKVGIRLVAALQDPTSKSMDLRFRRNCTLVAFKQGDRTQSDAFLGVPGAEQLSVGRFMARTDALVVGGGFAPTDEQILTYLSAKPVQRLEQPKWIVSRVQPQIGEPEPTAPQIIVPVQESLPEPTPTEPVTDIDPYEAKVLELHAQGKSMSAIIAQVWGKPSGASFYSARDKYMAILAKKGTSSSTSEPEVPQNGAFQPV